MEGQERLLFFIFILISLDPPKDKKEETAKERKKERKKERLTLVIIFVSFSLLFTADIM